MSEKTYTVFHINYDAVCSEGGGAIVKRSKKVTAAEFADLVAKAKKGNDSILPLVRLNQVIVDITPEEKHKKPR
jgi:hypothetical protein